MTESVLPDRTRVGRIALRANDLDRLVTFYCAVVGLAVLEREETYATLGAGETPLLELLAAPDAPPRGPEEAGLFHTAFLVSSRSALADALGRISENWHLDGASDHRVSEALYLSDPEGNGVEIYQDRPREEWPTREGRVVMDTRPLDLDALGDRRRGEAGVPDETTVGHVHLEVTDIPSAREFYVGDLGLNVRQEWSDAALFLAAGDYHHHLGLNTWNGRTAPSEGRGLAWFELVVPDREAFSTVRDRTGDSELAEGTDTLSLSDPDGIELRVRVEGAC